MRVEKKMEHGEKQEAQKIQNKRGYHPCLKRDRVGGGEAGCIPPLEEHLGGPGRGEGHQSCICDTSNRVSPSSQKMKGWEEENSRNIWQLLLFEDK